MISQGQALVDQAVKLLEQQKFAEASLVADSLVSLHPDSETSVFLKGICVFRMQQYYAALGWFRRLLRLNPNHGEAKKLLASLYQQPNLRWLRFVHESPVDLVLDVGANVGQFGSELRESGYLGQIISFEPVDDAYSQLQRRCADDPLWAAKHLAIGRSPGTLEINVAGNGAESSSFLPMEDRHLHAAPASSFVGKRAVEVESLTSFLASLADQGSCRLLKLDTQGFEGEIIAGSMDSIALFQFVHVELSMTHLYKGQSLIDGVLGLLYSCGFEIIDLQPYMTEPSTGHLMQANALLLNRKQFAPAVTMFPVFPAGASAR